MSTVETSEVDCETCDGTGKVPGEHDGKVLHDKGGFKVTATHRTKCSACDGSGRVVAE